MSNDTDATIIAPSPIIDKIWRQHIVDTRSYSQFRKKYGLIHRDPDIVADNLERQKNNTERWYLELFDNPLPSNQIWNFGTVEIELVDNSNHHAPNAVPLSAGEVL